MGPRSADRGIKREAMNKREKIPLQWGRDQLIAELRLVTESDPLC